MPSLLPEPVADEAASRDETQAFWNALARLVDDAPPVIDRPAGSRHPRFPHLLYPLDYGYLAGTTSMDGGGIDVWRGRSGATELVGIVCTVDLLKRDSEIKLLLGCTAEEVDVVLRFHNSSDFMKATAMLRPGIAAA